MASTAWSRAPHFYNVIPGGQHDFKARKSDLHHFSLLLFREPKPEQKEPDKSDDESKPASTSVGNSAYPRIHPDLRLTCRLKAPDAKKVQVVGNFGLGKGGPWEMERGAGGIWTMTTPPVIPGFHYYKLSVGGVEVNDPPAIPASAPAGRRAVLKSRKRVSIFINPRTWRTAKSARSGTSPR